MSGFTIAALGFGLGVAFWGIITLVPKFRRLRGFPYWFRR